MRAFSSCGKRGPLFIMVRRPLTVVASLIVEPRLQTHTLSSCGSWAQLLRSMWDPPRPGLEPVSPALAGRFSTTAPPGKPAFTLIIGNLQTKAPVMKEYVAFYDLKIRVDCWRGCWFFKYLVYINRKK